MPLNKTGGNMYGFITHTWNPLAGACPHECIYCYVEPMKEDRDAIMQKYSGSPRLISKELKTNLGHGNFIFVSNMADLFAHGVASKTIYKILGHMLKFPDNRYLLQTKNPGRFTKFINELPRTALLATTIETDAYQEHRPGRSAADISKAPLPRDRYYDFAAVPWPAKMVTIEPILAFNINRLLMFLLDLPGLQLVAIGADSKHSELAEPPACKIEELVERLQKHRVRVHLKPNLKRLIGAAAYDRLGGNCCSGSGGGGP